MRNDVVKPIPPIRSVVAPHSGDGDESALWREPPRESDPMRNRRERLLPLIAAIIAVVFGAMALIGMREKIVRVVPVATALYSAIGLKVNAAGLDLRGVTSKIVTEGGRKVLTVEGEIVNLRRSANRVPPMALAVRGADGRERYAWTAAAPKMQLAAGESVQFRARLAAPPADGADVQVRFASLGEAR
ncbi:hypothetical protein IY145_20135 [Methylosinus sp. H3A]|uniref:hypothetical protein n=1 Tax=Methylosinus sp. H3A TaxID=2785786 RepID=UPI0018C28426|nr:hypothetical protein [Methylosinus sp. H3A]MBG0811665.1 hypothetical protein [Methylosinus sp. H3A]